jgi:hypothetical protein
MRATPLILLLLTVPGAIAPPASANVGGYSFGGVHQTGDLVGFEPSATDRVRILEEELHVKFGPKSAEVEVRYLMRNETDRRVAVRFGFPVEETSDKSSEQTMASGKKRPSLPNLAYCKDYSIDADGIRLATTWQDEKRGRAVVAQGAGAPRVIARPSGKDEPKKLEVDGFEIDESRFTHLAGWLVSELAFKGHEEKRVRVTFTSTYPYHTTGSSVHSHDIAKRFKYRLSTAGCWAGTIGRGRIVLEPGKIDPADLRVISPVNRFRKEGDRWVWEFSDLEPTLADDLVIEASPESTSHIDWGNDTTYTDSNGKWTMTHSNYDVVASSTLAPEGDRTFDAENVKGNSIAAWSEGAPGPGIGEWLEFRPKVSKPLDVLFIKPGYHSDTRPELFEVNARPKRIRVEINGEHVQHFDIPDSQDVFECEIKGYRKPAAKVRIVFEEVWPGSQFEDLCVSGVFFHVRLDRQPDWEPGR